ncbi:MAG: hypothetical protein WBL88_02545 [Nitrososphaeraceae archaeon]
MSHILLSVFMIITVSSLPSIATILHIHHNALAKSVTTLSSQYVINTIRPHLSSSLMTTSKILSINGNIDLTNFTTKLEPFMILPGSKYTTRPENSSFSINLLNSEGKILAHYPFNPKERTYLPENKHKMGLISEAVPFRLGTKQIVISRDGNELASRNVSAHAPKVRIIFPNGGEILGDKVTVRWQASDADGNNLTYSLLYSHDAGQTWQTVVGNIKESQITVDLRELPGGARGLFRVIATDGVNTGIDDSDQTFTVPSSNIPIG